jgi:hypothetical protein
MHAGSGLLDLQVYLSLPPGCRWIAAAEIDGFKILDFQKRHDVFHISKESVLVL